MVSKADLKSLVELIKSATGLGQEEMSVQAGYKPKTLTQRLSYGQDLDAIYAQLKLVFGERLNNSTYKGKSETSSAPSDQFSANQLFQMFLHVSAAQTAILDRIESKMAREDTQAKIAANSLESLAGVLSLSIRQKQAIAEFRKAFEELKSQRSLQPPDSGRKVRETDGVRKKTGRSSSKNR